MKVEMLNNNGWINDSMHRGNTSRHCEWCDHPLWSSDKFIIQISGKYYHANCANILSMFVKKEAEKCIKLNIDNDRI